MEDQNKDIKEYVEMDGSVVDLDGVLNWTARMPANTEGQSQRVGVAKAILYQMGSSELQKMKSILNHAISRMNSLEKKWKEDRKRPNSDMQGDGMVAPVKTVIALPSQRCSKDTISRFLTSFPTSVEFQQIIKCPEWWKSFKKSDFVGFDCEFIQLKDKKGIDVHKAARVGIYSSANDSQLYKIKWNPEKVVINWWTKRVNGLTYNMLKDGEGFDEVQKKVKEKFQKKIIVTVAGGKDFRSLDLDEVEYPTFDLQSFYNRPDPNNSLCQQGMSLRDIFFLHFRSDCQKSKHCCLEDAKNTLKCFIDGHAKKSRNFWDQDGNKIADFRVSENLNSNTNKSLFWCDSMKLFAKNCECKACFLYK